MSRALVASSNSGSVPLAVDLQLELLDLRVARDREEVCRLGDAAAGVVEFLVHRGGGDLAVDHGGDGVLAHLQRRPRPADPAAVGRTNRSRRRSRWRRGSRGAGRSRRGRGARVGGACSVRRQRAGGCSAEKGRGRRFKLQASRKAERAEGGEGSNAWCEMRLAGSFSSLKHFSFSLREHARRRRG